MRNCRIKIAVLACLALLFISPVFLTGAYCGLSRGANSRLNRPGPRLLYPVTDDIILSGKDYLDFKWTIAYLPQTEYFYFRLYKGYNTTADNLVFKQNYSVNEYPISLPANMFEEGQVYTWVLVQVFLGGDKSDRSFSSFKIIKK